MFVEDEENPIVGVCGGIDAHGVVTGHHYRLFNDGDNQYHTPEERKGGGTTWRFDVQEQWFEPMSLQAPRNLTKDEVFAVEDWLIKHGYMKEE